ncbi:putative N6-adenosine-methyltransferase MT-A70-like [Ananas comosus]|uniref:Putative N6-adenosine-methyltransferase MT-A70-like n=1 Tax=Ananas comosus TaxID=4615 RepID=A0A199VBH7_ANACO|nr:putative N6-adenosine-methyltransferase MT-A70-like [Ananas comosus]
MEPQADGGGGDELAAVRDLRRHLEESIDSRRQSHLDLISSLHSLLPDFVSSLDLSLRIISSFNRRPFSPTPNPNPNPNPKPKPLPSEHPRRRPFPFPHHPHPSLPRTRPKPSSPDRGERLTLVRTMVAVCLLELVPFSEIDSASLLQRLESDNSSASPAERAALADLGRELGPLRAVETALRCIADESGAVQYRELAVGEKSVMMVWGIDRNKLLKELPETSSSQNQPPPSASEPSSGDGSNQGQGTAMAGVDNSGLMMQRAPMEMWMGPPDPQFSGMSPMFPGPMGGPRGGPRVMGLMGMPRMMGLPPLQRPLMGHGGAMSGINTPVPKQRTEEDDLKDLEALLNKKTFREKQKTKTGEEILDLIHRPTARETAVAAKFKTKGGSQLKEYCSNLTKEDCRRQSGSFVACDKVHFRRIIAPHTDTNLGDCSFLDTCRHTKLGEPQWINCDIRNFRMDILGQFGVIMADPPWDIHMELPYGTMADDEMRNLNVPALQTDGLIFLWVTGRAMELGRECLELWGYKRVEELIWVKTNQLQRIIRTGRTGHWLNHSKEHCLVGIKGDPEVNRNIDTDVIVAEVRETSRKPDEMYPLLERISPRTRKLELFARMHNTHAGWLSLGNQLQGVRLVDEGLRARFKATYPDVEVQPASPPRTTTATDADSNPTPLRSPFVDTRQQTAQYMEPSSAPVNYNSEGKPIGADIGAPA